MISKKAPLDGNPIEALTKHSLELYHKMKELDSTQQLLVANWQRKYYQLSDVLIDSLVGLTIVDTLAILTIARKEKTWQKNIIS